MADKKDIARKLFETDCVKFGTFTLKSGIMSPIYINMKALVSFPDVLRLIAEAYVSLLEPLSFDRMAAIPYGALPIVGAISMLNHKPWIYTRKEQKDYGMRQNIEGIFASGETAVLIDDLVSFGDSKIEMIKPFSEAGLLVRDVVVLIDRCQGAEEILGQHGLTLHSFLRLDEMLDIYLAEGSLTQTKVSEVKDFLANAKHP